MGPEALALIASYFLCSEAAKVQLLEPHEIDACTITYTEVKLSFVEGSDYSAFQRMDAEDRALVNQRGYLGYVDWREANPELVEEMEAEARRKLEIDQGWYLRYPFNHHMVA